MRNHKIDFEDVRGILDGYTFIRRSDRHGEVRYQIFGYLQGREVAVACTLRGGALLAHLGTARATRRAKENIAIVSRDSPRKGKTDWARFDAMTDEDIAKAVANDPDAVPIDIDWSDAVLVIPPKKKAISIRVDEDVLDYFKSQGDGYQRRINAVLRSYMQQKAKPKKRA